MLESFNKMASKNFSYVVVGGGIEGSATAYYLAKNGFKTVLLEQFRLGHTRGSSHGGSRITRKAYDEPFYVQMMIQSYKLWDELEKECGQKLFKKTGLLYLGAVDGQELAKCQNLMAANKMPHSMLDHKEIQEKYPQLKFDASWKALYDPEAGLLKADLCLKAFQDQFVKHGGVIHDGDAVTQIESDGKIAKIHTASGVQYSCEGVAICVGTWSKSFLDNFLGLKLPLQPLAVRACYWKVDKPGLYSVANGFPCILSAYDDTNPENAYYGLPSDEYPDMVKFCSHFGVFINHPDERDSVDVSEFVQKAQHFIEEHLDGVQAKPAVVETCMYTLTPDEHFILDKHPKYENIAIGAGFSGHGFKFGPVVGEILGSLLLRRSLPFDMNVFRIGRFN
jgi:sarcosine oxidase/L-pipecolate oxidase